MSGKIERPIGTHYPQNEQCTYDVIRYDYDEIKRYCEKVEARIAKLEAEIDVRKLVKPLEWELCESIVGDVWSTPALVGDIYFEVHNILNTNRVGLFLSDRDDSLCICYKDSESDAKQAAQEWLENYIAAACGQEEGK